MTKNIAVLTPTYDGKFDEEYVRSLWRTQSYAEQYGLNFHPIFLSGCSIVQRARNILFEKAYYANFDAVLFIDSDIQWNPLDAIKFCLSEEDVLCAAYRSKTELPEYQINLRQAMKEEDLVEIDGTGFGFVKIEKGVIDALWNLKLECYKEEDNLLVKNIFEVIVDDGELYGEDIVVFKKIKELGYKIILDKNVKINHIGRYSYRGDVKEHLKRV